jgi:CheY-like chemotaxis protein
VHILVVDDDRRVLDALQLLLERAGAVVETALSADAGVGAIERAVPDLVLSDLAMPDGDGCSMIRRIREREGGVRRLPAVAMTAHVADSDRQDVLDAGFDRYLTKPLDIDQLISTIARLVHAR